MRPSLCHRAWLALLYIGCASSDPNTVVQELPPAAARSEASDAGAAPPAQGGPRGSIHPPCQPITCLNRCGEVPDGCGRLLNCGSCPDQTPACRPETFCADQHLDCGERRACSGGSVVSCGRCEAGKVCGANGMPNHCSAPPAIGCADFELGERLPVTVLAPVVREAANNAQPGSCGVPGSVGSTRSFSWVAPESATYVFDTAGSNVDTVLAVRAEDCIGAELACNDDAFGEAVASEVTLPLSKGQRVVVVAQLQNNYGYERAAVRLHINRLEAHESNCTDGADSDADGRVDCRDPDCVGAGRCGLDGCGAVVMESKVPTSVAASTLPGEDWLRLSCGEVSRSERLFRWVAPRAGRFVFDTASPWTSIAALRSCAGPELACRAGYSFLGMHSSSAIRLDLVEGEEVLLAVEFFVANWDESQPWDELISFTLHVIEWQPTEQDCSDGLDNDADGSTDSRDGDCLLP